MDELSAVARNYPENAHVTPRAHYAVVPEREVGVRLTASDPEFEFGGGRCPDSLVGDSS